MPKADFNSKCLIPLLENLNSEDKFCFLMSNFNINLLKINNEYNNLKIYNTMCSYISTTNSTTYKVYQQIKNFTR